MLNHLTLQMDGLALGTRCLCACKGKNPAWRGTPAPQNPTGSGRAGSQLRARKERLQAAGKRMGSWGKGDKKEEAPDQRSLLTAVPRARSSATSGPETAPGGPAEESQGGRKAASEHA